MHLETSYGVKMGDIARRMWSLKARSPFLTFLSCTFSVCLSTVRFPDREIFL